MERDTSDYLEGIGGGAASGAATGMAAGPWGAAIGGVVGGGLGAITAAQKVEARKRRIQMMKDAKTYQGNANPYINQEIAKNNYQGLSQETELANKQIDTNSERATTNVQQTGTGAGAILSALSNIQANSNETKRKVAGDVQGLKDRRAATLMGANEGVMQDQQAVFNDKKQKEAAIIKAETGADAADAEQRGKTTDLIAGAALANAPEIMDSIKGIKRKPKLENVGYDAQFSNPIGNSASKKAAR